MSWDPVPAKDVSIKGLNGSGVIAFIGSVKHGSGKREVTLTVEPETIIALADALVCCREADQAGDPSDSPYTLPGHAVWHMEHPDAPRPCPRRSS